MSSKLSFVQFEITGLFDTRNSTVNCSGLRGQASTLFGNSSDNTFTKLEQNDVLYLSAYNIMYTTDQLINIAYSIAELAHAKQFRKDGKPYITHIDAVARIVNEEYYRLIPQNEAALRIWGEMKPYVIMAAILHDTIEDTDVTPEYLRARGIPEYVIDTVLTLSKRPGETYFDFTMRVHDSGNPGAKVVKLADLTHNMSDLKEGAQKDKYRLAYHILNYFNKDDDKITTPSN